MLGDAGVPIAEVGGLQTPITSLRFAAAEALARLATSGSDAERTAACEAMAAEGAVVRLVELLIYDDHGCRQAVVALMLQLCDSAPK